MTSYPRRAVLGFLSLKGSFKAYPFLYKYAYLKTKASQLGLLEQSPLSLLLYQESSPECDLVSFILQSLYLCGLVTCVPRFCPAQVLIGEALWTLPQSRIDPTKNLSKSDKR